jgi:hypothetical protein
MNRPQKRILYISLKLNAEALTSFFLLFERAISKGSYTQIAINQWQPDYHIDLNKKLIYTIDPDCVDLYHPFLPKFGLHTGNDTVKYVF